MTFFVRLAAALFYFKNFYVAYVHFYFIFSIDFTIPDSIFGILNTTTFILYYLTFLLTLKLVLKSEQATVAY